MCILHSAARLRAALAALALALSTTAALAQRSAAGATPAPGATPAAAAAAAASTARAASSSDRSVLIDRVVAIVNDEALTQYDVTEQTRTALAQMKQQNVSPPAPDVLEKQLLEYLITQRVLLQYAKEQGIRVDDTQVERTIARIAQDNKMTMDEFKQAVAREGLDFSKYREDIRFEMLKQRLLEREVDPRVTVSDAEVDLFLATQDSQAGGEVEYRVAHILVRVPEQATPEQIDQRVKRVEEAMRQLRSGGDFGQVAATFSDAPDALQGGNLGWRAPARLPQIFLDPLRSLKPGQYSGVLRSAAGFHIVKLLETRSRNDPTVVEQTRVRHILIKVNEVNSDLDAKAKIERIKERIDLGATFDEQAKLNSEDGSASKGGELGWISPGDTVPDFEAAMNRLKVGEISGPVRTPFGWHLIEVEERRTQDVTKERQRDQARIALRQRKSDEMFQDWVRQQRDRTYVEIKADEK
ncbi:MAG TPA: peptidylprolyl isomerase [Casimicrobiaceae bacterium]|nr:peptidylprolyl isomerase [Casimicrobiaceae bacterium]